LVLLGADQGDDQIDEGPQAQAAEGDELEDAGPDLAQIEAIGAESAQQPRKQPGGEKRFLPDEGLVLPVCGLAGVRSEEHTSELQSRFDLVCRLLLEKKKKNQYV